MIFSWQTTQWQQLIEAAQSGHLPHALLLSGQAGTGKAVFADIFSQALVCQQPKEGNMPCQQCHLCRLAITRVHPDIRWLEPEKPGQAIKVDDIREICEFCQYAAMQGNYRIAIINVAENMNMNAANALLKTLEEPAPNTFLILISNQAPRLLPTILSRCQKVVFPRPEKELALDWLRNQLSDANKQQAEMLLTLAQGSPLAALSLNAEDVLQQRKEMLQSLCELMNQPVNALGLASKWKDANLEHFFDIFITWLMDIARIEYSGYEIINQDFSNQIAAISKKQTVEQWISLLSQANRIRHDLTRGINLNKQLALESMLIRYCYPDLLG